VFTHAASAEIPLNRIYMYIRDLQNLTFNLQNRILHDAGSSHDCSYDFATQTFACDNRRRPEWLSYNAQ